MKISKAISPKVTGLSTLEPSPVAEKSAPVETPPQAISVPVDPSTQLGARKRGLAASSLLQSTLRGKEQMPVGAGMLSFLGGANSEKNILKALGTLGIKGESLKDPGVQQGLRDVRSAAGFAPGALDGEETMTSLMMAMAQKDRAVGAGPQSGVGDFNMNRVTAVDVENWKPGKSDVSADHLVEIGKKGKMSVNADVAKDVAPHLNAAMAEGNIDTPEKKAAFVAQTIFESGGYRYREALNNVAGSGGRATTEAQKYKSRGYLHLTGKENYRAAGEALGLDLVNTPELAALPENAARVAAWQWNSRGLNEQAQAGDFATTTKRLSGRLNHQAEREALHGASLAALTNSKGAPNATLAAAPNAGAIDATASTSGMSESQKYDHYRSIIEANGGSVKDAPGQRHVLGLRTEDHKVNAYDDKMAVLWRDQNGSPRVREFASNMESISRYQGRYGNDLNRDGRRDLATLEAGNYEYTRGSSRTFGQVLRPVGTTPVMRDTTGDGHGDRRDARGAGGSILFHAGGRRDTGSAGCQTLPPDQFRQFLGALGSDRRVSYTVVDVE